MQIILKNNNVLPLHQHLPLGGGWAWLLNMYVYKFKDDISTLQTLNNVTEVTLQLNDKDVELHWFHGIRLRYHASNPFH